MNELSLHSKIKEVYANPIGRDILKRLLLQMNNKESLLTNQVVSNLKLKTLARLTKKVLGEEFFEVFLELLNTEKDLPLENAAPIQKKWWKEAVFYQIYPISFMDSNGDGKGDLKGILSKLDYLKDLGVDAIWLSPIYESPYDDNGYDISNYYEILHTFGTMEEFDALLAGIHERGMRLIMDLVVNHTSDEHPWFQDAIHNKESKYKDYYLFKKSGDGKEPNNWTSFFSGPAWNYYDSLDEWGLHLFSKKQMDLNWDNENVRKDIGTMVRWWMEKGIDGFRLDVINYISKKPLLPMGNEQIGQLMGYYGIEHYFYGPNLHQYLRELKETAFAPYDGFSVGETPGVGMEMSKLLTADYRKELDMVFSFDHLETPGHVRFDDYEYDLNYLKKYFVEWMTGYGSHCWMSLFYENHDNPRMISKVNKKIEYRVVLGKLLATIQFTLRGTPFIFQGQEIGAVNKNFHSIEDIRDIESINLYEELIETKSKGEAFAKVLAGSRDHARTPMQWNASEHGGFTTGTPWILNDEDYKDCNVEQQLKDNSSVLHFYKDLIALRKYNIALIYGEIDFVDVKKKNLFCYYRRFEEECFYIECNLSEGTNKRFHKINGYQLLLSNYNGVSEVLRPYECAIYKVG